MKKILNCFIIISILLTNINIASAVDEDKKEVMVTIPDTNITVDDILIDNIHNKYPFIVHKNIFYLPLSKEYTQTTGIKMTVLNNNELEIEDTLYRDIVKQDLTVENRLDISYKASILDKIIYLNDMEISNVDEEYPFLIFRDIIYMPLTKKTSNALGWYFGWTAEKRFELDSTVWTSHNTVSDVKVFEDWIYFIKSDLLYKMRMDGSDKTIFSDIKKVNSINIYDEWIYYSVTDYNDEYNGIYKIKPDGTDHSKIVDGISTIEYINKDGLFYTKKKVIDDKKLNFFIDSEKNNYFIFPEDKEEIVLYFVDFNEKKHREVLELDTDYSRIKVFNDEIFYIKKVDNNLYKKEYEDKEEVLIAENVKNYIIKDEWIYYTGKDKAYLNPWSGLGLFRVDYNGKRKVQIISENINDWKILEDKIFYINADDGNKLYSIKTNVKNRTKISDQEMGHISILKDNIFYYNMNDDKKLYKMNIDGTENLKLRDTSYSDVSIWFMFEDWIYYENEGYYRWTYSDRLSHKDHKYEFARINLNDLNEENLLPNRREDYHIMSGKRDEGISPVRISKNGSYEIELEELKRKNNALVFIETYDKNDNLIKTGTGALIDSEGKVVTSYSTISDGLFYKVTFKENEELKSYYTYSILNANRERNIALLDINKDGSSEDISEDIPMVIGSTRNLVKGQKIFIVKRDTDDSLIGYEENISEIKWINGLKSLMFLNSVVENKREYILLDSFGEVAGILSNNMNEIESYGIPSVYIEQLLNEERTILNYDLSNSTFFLQGYFINERFDVVTERTEEGYNIDLMQNIKSTTDYNRLLKSEDFKNILGQECMDRVYYSTSEFDISKYKVRLFVGNYIFSFKYNDGEYSDIKWEKI